MDPFVCVQYDVVAAVHMHKADAKPGRTIFYSMGTNASCLVIAGRICHG